jgi:hypothetical protein
MFEFLLLSVKQNCLKVKSNQVKNEPEVNTYFQNSIREEANFSYLESACLGRRAYNKLWQRDSKSFLFY